MSTIVAIGGGEMGRPGTPVETTAIDAEVVRLTGKRRPRVLFMPTASGDSEGYCDVFRRQYGERLGCRVEVLRLFTDRPSKSAIRDAILSADIIYVGGGNTLRMLRLWRKLGIDSMLRAAWKQGVVLAGLSAGSICWFMGGPSDSRKIRRPDAGYIRVSGLGFIGADHSPHFDSEPDRRPALKRIMRHRPSVAIAIENCAAMVIQGDTYRIIRSKRSAGAYRTYWRRGQYVEEVLPTDGVPRSLHQLLSR